MKEYRVKWEIDIEADTPEDAALQAHVLQRSADTDSIATVFDVSDENGRKVRVDLTEETSTVIQEECKGKAAAMALAVLVLTKETRDWLAEHDPQALKQAEDALRPFGYPEEMPALRRP